MIVILEKVNKLKIEKRAFINGEHVEARDKSIILKKSSVDGRDLSGIAACDAVDINLAVKIAKEKFEKKEWLNKSLKEKKEIMYRLADLMERNKEELALLDTIETGRAFKNYYYDSIPKAIEAIRWFAEAVDKYYENSIPTRKNEFAYISKEPLGVVGIITPWNDPLVVASWKFAPALLMGNSVVLKPAEQSSFSILKVAKLALEAGIPKGVFNVVTGYGDAAGKALALNNDVRGIFFTGSTKVGKLILQYSGQSNMKKVGLECGGKSPFIVSKKCNKLEKAAKVLAKNIFYNQGQICSAPSKLIIEESIKEDFVEILKEESKIYIPGNPLNVQTEVGRIINEHQKNKVLKYIENAKKEGARVLNKENILELEENAICPVIFDSVDLDSEIVKDEIFGPVLVVISYKNIQEALKIANETKYGLAASIWTDDLNEAYQISRGLEAGIVHINSYGEDDNSVPFGGIKESGLGKDKSVYAFDEYTYSKTVWQHFDDLK